MVYRILAVVVGLIASMAIGSRAGWVLKKAIKVQIVDPSWPNEKELKRATILSDEPSESAKYGAKWVGYFECIFFFSALWLGQGYLIAGWLAFKVATKWAAWQHVIRLDVTSRILVNPIHELQYRNSLGTWLASRLLVGTLYGILCGLAGYAAADIVLFLGRVTG